MSFEIFFLNVLLPFFVRLPVCDYRIEESRKVGELDVTALPCRASVR